MRVLSGVLFFLWSMCSSFALEFDPDVPQGLKQQVVKDLGFIDSLSLSRVSGLHRDIFGGALPGEYKRWFDSRVSFFGFGDCGGSGRAVACVLGRNDRKIWVTGNYTGIDHPGVARLMTLYHEARHTEADRRNWPHSRCSIFYPYSSIWTGNRLRWRHACDRTEFGSYGSASVLLNNIARFCGNCTEKVRSDAELYSSDQILRITRKSALRRLRQDFRE
jgi:hypothetical protein